MPSDCHWQNTNKSWTEPSHDLVTELPCLLFPLMARSGDRASENGSDLRRISKNRKRLLKFRESCRLGRRRARESKLETDASKAVALQRRQGLLSIQMDVDAATLPVSSRGWMGKKRFNEDKSKRLPTPPLQELLGKTYNMRLINWDGRCVRLGWSLTHSIYSEHRTPTPIADTQKRIVAMLGGMPRAEEGWMGVCAQAEADLATVRSRCTFSSQQKCHRRGEFPALAIGISFGGGQKVLPLLN
jgi:hypothetical protein